MLKPQSVIISLRSARFDQLQSFYSNLLGGPKEKKAGAWARFQLPGCVLVLWHAEGFQPVDGGLQLCFTVEDLKETHNRLVETYTVSPIKQASHGSEAFLNDPDGNSIILYQPTRS